MVMLFLIILCSCASLTDSHSKRASAKLVLADKVGKHIYKCPLKHFVVGFTLKKEKVRCQKFRAPAKKRDSTICKWQRECYDSDKSNQQDFRIARGLRFVHKKRKNKKAKAKAKPQVQLYCCKENCTSFDCKVKLFSKPIVGAESKKVEFINKVIHEKRKKAIKAELCRPRCPPIARTEPGASGDSLGGILGGITKKPCLPGGSCAVDGVCCGDQVCLPFPNALTCFSCGIPGKACMASMDCCSSICNNNRCS